MTPRYCPHCGGELPVMVIESDIRAAVENFEQKDPAPPTLPWPGWATTYTRNLWRDKEPRNG